MKIITGINKKNFIKKIKLISFKQKQLSYKYHIIRHIKVVYFIYDRREESKCNDIILLLPATDNGKQVLKIIK